MTPRCSFCGAWPDDVARLVAGPEVMICDRCIQSVVASPRVPGEATLPVCSFCKVEAPFTAGARGGAQICHACFELCLEIVREGGHELPPASLPRATLRPPRRS